MWTIDVVQTKFTSYLGDEGEHPALLRKLFGLSAETVHRVIAWRRNGSELLHNQQTPSPSTALWAEEPLLLCLGSGMEMQRSQGSIRRGPITQARGKAGTAKRGYLRLTANIPASAACQLQLLCSMARACCFFGLQLSSSWVKGESFISEKSWDCFMGVSSG